MSTNSDNQGITPEHLQNLGNIPAPTGREALQAKLTDILKRYDKQVADLERGYPVETQRYFTTNQILALLDAHVAEECRLARLQQITYFNRNGFLTAAGNLRAETLIEELSNEQLQG